MSILATALEIRLDRLQKPIFSNYEIFKEMWEIFKRKEVRYLRGNTPTQRIFYKTKYSMWQNHIISPDKDYSRLWKFLKRADLKADEVVCLADPYCYISHLSAMQRYGLTNRRPTSLQITLASNSIVRPKMRDQMQSDYGNYALNREVYTEPLQRVQHPSTVRGRHIDTFTTSNYGSFREIRGEYARVSSIGQTFFDMIEQSKKCGGMLHVLEVWKEHAIFYLDEIINTFDASNKSLQKVRAGYIISEVLEIQHPTVLSWKRFAQRGGSQVLDANRPYSHNFSQDWMLSINVG